VCRHVGYLGSAVSVAELLYDRPHSLVRQSWAPVDMRSGGTVNVDGFGVGWYPHLGGEPVRYRRAGPIWADENLPGLARTSTATAVLAAIRSGTVGMPVTDTACAPFADGRWLFSHNGVVRDWPASVSDIAKTLPVTDLLTLDAPTDSALVWALVRNRLRQGEDPAAAVGAVVVDVAAAAPGSRLNLLLTDGDVLIGTAWTHALSLLVTDTAVVLASEPYDSDERWQEIPDGHLVVATRGEGTTSSTVDVRAMGQSPLGRTGRT
jgi:glutamine amidotransferase